LGIHDGTRAATQGRRYWIPAFKTVGKCRESALVMLNLFQHPLGTKGLETPKTGSGQALKQVQGYKWHTFESNLVLDNPNRGEFEPPKILILRQQCRGPCFPTKRHDLCIEYQVSGDIAFYNSGKKEIEKKASRIKDDQGG
jgi:hypothetical protein